MIDSFSHAPPSDVRMVPPTLMAAGLVGLQAKVCFCKVKE